MIGEAITITGQASDRHIEGSLNEYMNKVLKTSDKDYVIAGDTDSVYLNVEDIVKLRFPNGGSIETITKFLDKFGAEAIQKVLDKSIKYMFDLTNSYEPLMDMKREAIASKALWTKKKRYAMMVHNSEGVDYSPYKLKIMGLDIIKSSTPHRVRAALKKAMPIIFEQGESELQKYVAKMETEFKSWPIEDIAFPRSANDIEKYHDNKTIYKSACPIHVRGALLYNHHCKSSDPIRSGDKLKFIYLKTPNTIQENCISFPTSSKFPEELKLAAYVDFDLQFEKTFMTPLEGITESIGWDLVPQSSLEDFFA